MQTDRASTVPDALALAQAYQDSIIAKRLPAWLKAATTEELQQLRAAMRRSLDTRRHLSRVLAQIEGIDAFATPILASQMQAKFGHAYNVRRWQMLVGNREVVINALPVGAHLTEVKYEPMPLLEAALRNFTEAETASDRTLDGAQPRGNRLLNPRQGRVTPPSADQFARFCRELDLGAQYQQHLDEALQPTSGFDQASGTPRLLADAHRDALLVDAYEAKLTGVLTQAELQLIAGLCNDNALGRLNGDPVVANRLQLLGHTMQQIVVLAVMDEGIIRNTIKRVLVHIPGDEHGAWCAFESLRKFANALGRRLREPSYQKFFTRFVRRRDSQAFFGEIIPAYADLVSTANYELNEEVEPYGLPLFNTLATARIAQIKDDAAMIAVPVAKLDRAVEVAHNRRLAAEGWTLLNLAGLFVPAIGLGLLAITAWRLLGEVYHGIDAWREGDDNEALGHLLNVGGDVAAMTVTSAGLLLTRRLWHGATVVDELVPAHLEDGTVKLWNQDLLPYRLAGPAPGAVRDAQGIHRLGTFAWVEIDGGYYAVEQRVTTGAWRLLAREGHAPLLCHNGAGAWRLWSEQPAQWDDLHTLFRRFGEDAQGLDEEQIDQVLAAHALDAEHLRGLHVYGRALDPEVMDTVLRVKLDQRIRNVIGDLRSGKAVTDQLVLEHARSLLGNSTSVSADLANQISPRRRELFQRLYESMQETDSSGVAQLRRVFTSLHGPAARGLISAASVTDRRLLEVDKRISLSLSEAARNCVQRIRTARAYESLVIDSPQNADTARAAVAMSKYLPNASTGIRWRLLEAGSDANIKLLDSESGTRQRGLLHRDGRFQLLDDQGTAVGAPGELFDIMASAYDEGLRQSLGVGDPIAHNLRVLLARLANVRRAQVQALFGRRQGDGVWFTPPQRIQDGRIGYPLSGRGEGGAPVRRRPQALFAIIRSLYPSFSDEQSLTWISDVQAAGLNLESELQRLGQELEALGTSLHQWQMRAPMGGERSVRREFRESLVNCWRRRLTYPGPATGQTHSYRWAIFNLSLPALPELPSQVSFGHVTEMAVFEVGLTALPEQFIRAFPNLRTLELPGNRLTQLPLQLMQIRSLQSLDLFGNQIVMTPAQATILACCESLEYINLSFNPLGRVFSLAGLGRLRRLHMRSTGINQLPNALTDRPDLLLADLRDNQIDRLPEHFYRAPGWIRRSILVRGNPLTEMEISRLRASLEGVGTLREEVVVDDVGHSRRRWLDACQSTHRGEFSLHWDNLQSAPRSGEFFSMLTLLLRSADFHQSPQALADRVYSMIVAMSEYSSLREELFNEVDETNCQDGAALTFSNLELRMLVWQTQRGAEDREEGLLHLGRQLWRLDEVNRIALEEIQARRKDGADPDEVEVGLAYRVSLRDALDLPAQPGGMLFRESARVDEAGVADALARVREAETSATVAASLVERGFWQDHLQRTYGARFEAVDAPFHEQLNVLMDEQAVPDGERLTEMNRVRDARQAAQRQLMEELTLAALEPGADPQASGGTEEPVSPGASAV
ncbi:NEL-type E3 ubiquitin ligase domain-containing protein [Pseudomonas sp. HS6-2]|uniref:NEL-type E3 ubiquitin ligase domain-containing protein n=1 Tax=Pseudomonas sp. HS6-2 TaxID=3410986 RepID=UPI003BCB5251